MDGDNGVYYATQVDSITNTSTWVPGCYRHGDTLEDARDVLATDVRYYQDLGQQVVRAAIVRMCAACSGTGHVRKARGRGTKLCPACRGKDAQQVAETWIMLPCAAWISEALRQARG